MISISSKSNQNFQFQLMIVAVGVLLFIIKIFAYFLTKSVAVLTDALESIINILSAIFGLYSLYLSALPRDKNHPYGHGKIEFIAASIEGILVGIAGLGILYKVVDSFRNPVEISSLEYGTYLIAFTAVANYILGEFAERKGKKQHSPALVATGKHLKTDTYSTLGIILGLILIYFTEISWIDSVTALFFGLLILYTAYKILRESVSGIMDETDQNLLQAIARLLQQQRRNNWIDVHNLRIIKYGATLHIDCHMTIPWYFNTEEGHREIEVFEDVIKDYFGDRIEMFVHLDACKEFSCSLCKIADCPMRKHNFVKEIEWNAENICENVKHKPN